MITIKFGLKADMRSKSLTSPALNTLLGDISAITANGKTEVTAGTTNGGSMVLSGKFKFSNENSLRDSDVTGVAFFDKSKHFLMSVANVGDVSFSDIGRQEKVQTIATFMLRDVASGVAVQGSAFGDVLLGYAGKDKLFGNAGDDILRGAAGNDSLSGGLGADRLDGGLGRDVMAGGKGNDSYTIDNANDIVSESVASGTDKAQSSVTWTMGANLETLTLGGSKAISATGNALGNDIFGNSAANTLRGLAGNDRLDGKGGADRMDGGLGNDQFMVDHRNDVVVERSGQGTDTLRSTVSYSLPAHVENLTLLGSADINATGNALDNVLRGNAGDNVLKPGHGDDRLVGNGGADTFIVTGGAGDTLRIDDLLAGDHLAITHAAVSAITGSGTLDAAELRAAGDAPNGAHLVYDQDSGVLSYDALGDGSSLSTLVTLLNNHALLASEITILPA
jgi:Ca2+-binding RTX toxin-like protein